VERFVASACRDCAIGAAHARGERPDVDVVALVRREEVEVPKVTMVEHEGVTKPLGQWAREAGMDTETLRCRVKAGWSFAKALSTPVMSPRESGALSSGPGKTRRTRASKAPVPTPAEAVRDVLASVPVVELLTRLGYSAEDAGLVPAGRLLLIRGAT
jgi:hypothetical protein